MDIAKVRAALNSLVERKPYLAARRPVKFIAQGARTELVSINLATILRNRA